MKTLTAITALLIALSAPLSAQSITEKVTGCATIDKGGYLNLAKPGCLGRTAGDDANHPWPRPEPKEKVTPAEPAEEA